ncbi:MAG: phage portal protein [Patescibacteria group bacterium]|nr:phage portal protein [Patescibacteria group bacterium]
MSFFGNIFSRISQRFNALENPNVPITASGIISAGGGAGGSIFVGMNDQTALSVSTVWSCIKTISETLSTATPQLYEDATTGKRKAKESYLYELLTVQPNSWMGWDTLVELTAFGLLVHGNAFIHIERNMIGQPVGLVPLPADCMKIMITGNTKTYIFRPTNSANANPSGQQIGYTIPASDMLHVMGMSRDGIIGLSPIMFAANSIGLANIVQEFQSRWFYQGVHPAFLLQSMSNLTQDNRLQLRESIKATLYGMAGVGRPFMLPHGVEPAKFTADKLDAEILKLRDFSIQDICQWFRLRPADIGIAEKVSGAAATLTTIQFLQSAILPWASKIEREIGRKLLHGLGLTFTFDFDHLLRADIATQTDLTIKKHAAGLMTGNESRIALGLQAIPDDPYLNGFVVPQATVNAAGLFVQPPEPPATIKPVEVLPPVAEEPRQLPEPKTADLQPQKSEPTQPRAANAADFQQQPDRTAQNWLKSELERVHRRHVQKMITALRRGESIEQCLHSDLQPTVDQITPAAKAFGKDPAKMGKEFIDNEIAHFGNCRRQDDLELQDSVFTII